MKKVDVILEMLTRPTLGTEGISEEVGIMQLVVMPLMVWPILKKQGRMEEGGIKKVVTAVVEVTKKTAVVVVTVLHKTVLERRLLMLNLG